MSAGAPRRAGADAAVRVLVVDDSPTVREMLAWLVERCGFAVAGLAEGVADAEKLVLRRRPDLVLTDLHLADGDGLELTRRVLAEHGVPILLITSDDPGNPELALRALHAGALEVLAKPPAATHPDFEAYAKSFRRTVATLAGTPIVRRRPRQPAGVEQTVRQPAAGAAAALAASLLPPLPFTTPPVVAVAGSTGAPLLVGDLLQALPEGGYAFALVAQHIVPEFADSFRGWLAQHTRREVRFAAPGELPRPGGLYVAPPRCHLQLGPDGRFRTPTAAELPAQHLPAADVLFASLAAARPRDTLAVQLSGMGADGAAGLAQLHVAGALTVVQAPETAAVDAMPRRAIELGGATAVLAPEQIAALLRSLPAPPRR